MLTPTSQMFSISVNLPLEDGDLWPRHVDTLCQALDADLRSRHLVAKSAPPIDGIGSDAVKVVEQRQPYRVICAYDPFPIIGLLDELDDEGEPMLEYGPPCYKLRVDTFAEEAA